MFIELEKGEGGEGGEYEKNDEVGICCLREKIGRGEGGFWGIGGCVENLREEKRRGGGNEMEIEEMFCERGLAKVVT